MSGICECITAYKLTDVLPKARRLKRIQQVLVDHVKGTPKVISRVRAMRWRSYMLQAAYHLTVHSLRLVSVTDA